MTVLFLLITGCLVKELLTINASQRRIRRRKPRWLLLITIIWFFTITTNPVPGILAGILENRYPVFDTQGLITGDTTTYIAVLGAGYCLDPSLPTTGKLSPTSLGRMTEAVRIHKMMPNSILVTFGQSKNTPADAEGIFARAAIEMGVNPGNVIRIGNAVNTWSVASEFTTKFGQESSVIIVTDAIHMTRAMKFFNEFGLKTFAAPTNFTSRLSSDSIYQWMPSTTNINIMTYSMHELTALAFYNLLLSDNLNNKSWKKMKKASTLTNWNSNILKNECNLQSAHQWKDDKNETRTRVRVIHC